MKNYQTGAGRAGTTGRTTPKKARAEAQRSAHESAIALPDAVSVAVGELAGELEEGLLAFAVGAGLQVLGAILEAEVTALAGPKGRHDAGRSAVRHGSDDGLVTLGGRQVSVSRPRVRTADRSAEVAHPPTSWSLRPSCSGAWPWSACWPRCPPAATVPPSNPSDRP